jgi:hypothetical protein
MMSKSAAALINEAVKAKPGLPALAKIAAARAAHADEKVALELATHDVIVEARDEELTWPEIGAALGLTAQRAQQLARPVA